MIQHRGGDRAHPCLTGRGVLIRGLPNRGFTLVEILAVLVIISIMGGMVLTAVQGVSNTAKSARTRSIIETVNGIIQDQYDSYKYRAFSIEPPNFDQLTPSGDTFGYELLAGESARIRLLMVRDLQRMEMPDRLSDIRDAPSLITAAVNPILKDTADHDNDGDLTETVGIRDDNSQRKTFVVSGFDPRSFFPDPPALADPNNVPPRLASYRERIPAKKADGTNFDFDQLYSADAPESQNQGAECLYLILATTFTGGRPAISSIPASNIGDTDGDNLLEILDGWGRPLGFVRWPVGFRDPEGSIDTTTPNQFDLYRSDFAYVNGATKALAVDVNFSSGGADPKHPTFRTAPWALRPLIFSAGPDGEFGITSNPWTNRTDPSSEKLDYSYRHLDYAPWPVNADWMGVEAPGRLAGYMVIDPFMRRFVGDVDFDDFVALLPGQEIPGRSDERSDDITNYGVQSEQ